MSTRTIAFAFAIAALAYPVAYAADDAAAKPAEAPAAAPMPMDCGVMMPRHDHGAEKGTPTPQMSMKCPVASTAEAAPANVAPKTKARRGHDHARTHKLM